MQNRGFSYEAPGPGTPEWIIRAPVPRKETDQSRPGMTGNPGISKNSFNDEGLVKRLDRRTGAVLV